MDEQERKAIFNITVMPHISGEAFYVLEQRGFFTAPASRKHHGNYEGGLFDHSWAVVQHLNILTKRLGLEWARSSSPLIIGMFHDLCKIGDYTKDENGFWVSQTNNLIPGHGEKSVMMAQALMRLTNEEVMCIRWHMGAFDDKALWDYYGRAVTKYPNVLWTHTADMLASHVDNV